MFAKMAWSYYRELRAGGYSRESAKAIAAAYLSNLRWDAGREKLAVMNREGQI